MRTLPLRITGGGGGDARLVRLAGVLFLLVFLLMLCLGEVMVHTYRAFTGEVRKRFEAGRRAWTDQGDLKPLFATRCLAAGLPRWLVGKARSSPRRPEGPGDSCQDARFGCIVDSSVDARLALGWILVLLR